MRLEDYVCFNGLIKLELVAITIALALVILSFTFSIFLLRKARRKG